MCEFLRTSSRWYRRRAARRCGATPGTTVAAPARCSASNSSSTVYGAARHGCRRTASAVAPAAAARMSAAVRAGVRHTAAYRETWSFTATLRAPGGRSPASSQVRSSPVTRMTSNTPNQARRTGGYVLLRRGGRRAADQRPLVRRAGGDHSREGHRPEPLLPWPGRQVLLARRRLELPALRHPRGVLDRAAAGARRDPGLTQACVRALLRRARRLGCRQRRPSCRPSRPSASRRITCSTCCCRPTTRVRGCSRTSRRRASRRRSTTCRCTTPLAAAGSAARPTDCPVSSDVSARLVRLPFFNTLSASEVERVAETLVSAVRNAEPAVGGRAHRTVGDLPDGFAADDRCAEHCVHPVMAYAASAVLGPLRASQRHHPARRSAGVTWSRLRRGPGRDPRSGRHARGRFFSGS